MTSPADRTVLERVLRESGVDQAAAGPTWWDYLRALMEALLRWLHDAMPKQTVFDKLGDTVVFVALAVLAVVVVLGLVVAVRSVLARRRGQPADAAVTSAPAPSPPPDRSRAQWRDEVERRLRAGDIAGALEALWWWFARSLAGAPVDPAWTSGELLRHADRPELAPVALALDRLLYGAERPDAEGVRRFLERGEAALP